MRWQNELLDYSLGVLFVALAAVVLIGVVAFYAVQSRRLLAFARRRHHRRCWEAAEPPHTPAEVDDPLVALLGRLCCRARTAGAAPAQGDREGERSKGSLESSRGWRGRAAKELKGS